MAEDSVSVTCWRCIKNGILLSTISKPLTIIWHFSRLAWWICFKSQSCNVACWLRIQAAMPKLRATAIGNFVARSVTFWILTKQKLIATSPLIIQVFVVGGWGWLKSHSTHQLRWAVRYHWWSKLLRDVATSAQGVAQSFYLALLEIVFHNNRPLLKHPDTTLSFVLMLTMDSLLWPIYEGETKLTSLMNWITRLL